MPDSPSTETLCQLIEQWILDQLPQPTAEREKLAAAAVAKTIAVVMPPTIRHLCHKSTNPP